MHAEMTITPIDNVDTEYNKVIDNSNISKRGYAWESTIKVHDVVKDKELTIQVKDVSLYNHRLILENKLHYILHMLSK